MRGKSLWYLCLPILFCCCQQGAALVVALPLPLPTGTQSLQPIVTVDGRRAGDLPRVARIEASANEDVFTFALRLPPGVGGNFGIGVAVLDTNDCVIAVFGQQGNIRQDSAEVPKLLLRQGTAISPPRCLSHAPELLTANPDRVSSGGEDVTLWGWDFQPGARVRIADIEVKSEWLSPVSLRARTPALPGARGDVPVTISNPSGATDRQQHALALHAWRIRLQSELEPRADWPAVGDLDGDGWTDAAWGSGWWDEVYTGVLAWNQTGHFTTEAIEPLKNLPRRIVPAIGDLDGDGRPDLLFVQPGGLHVLRNLGQRRLEAAVPQFYPDDLELGQAFLDDLNGDGRLDLITVNTAAKTLLRGTTVRVLLNQGSGRFSAPQAYSAGSRLLGVTLADLDRDGRSDVIWLIDGSGEVQLLRNRGDGSMEPPRTLWARMSGCLSVADMDGDGWLDLLGNEDSTHIGVRLSAGRLSFQTGYDYAVPEYTCMTAGDFDEDGRMDLLASGGAAIRGQWGQRPSARLPTPAPPSFPTTSLIVDFNRDGRLDVLWGWYVGTQLGGYITYNVSD